MAKKFRAVKLDRYWNALRSLPSRKGAPKWHKSVREELKSVPAGVVSSWGIPFALDPEGKKFLELAPKKELSVPLRGQATHICFLHLSNPIEGPACGGEHLADYIIEYADGTRSTHKIRRRFEINQIGIGWGAYSFNAMPSWMPCPLSSEEGAYWGRAQTGLSSKGLGFTAWVYALENPSPDKPLQSIKLRSVSEHPIAIFGITLYNGPGHPLRHLPRGMFRLTLPPGVKALPEDVRLELDMGNVVRLFAVPGIIDEKWVKAEDAGLGKPKAPPRPKRHFLFEATGSEGATLKLILPGGKTYRIPFGEIVSKKKATSPDRKVRVEIIHPSKRWIHTTVVDASTGKPTPVRIHFCGPNGEYIPPYGHHDVINDNWFEDYGGDLKLGDMSYAYVPGSFQIELPVGEVYVEIWKGFEYAPLRKKLHIRPGQRELKLTINRSVDLRSEGWLTADTHVHFISPQTAWLEGQAEGVNLINLLASQWGRLYTNVADITGELSGCSRDDTLVWVGTENRNHLLGHISLLGTHGDPVFPMCTGGPSEAYLGDPDVTTLTEWAKECKERQGVVIRPHFPSPVCEEPVYFIEGELDGVELRRFANPDSGSLDEFCFNEWYRYLNCGYRVSAVGGTDKMSAGMPVGGARTYAQLLPGDEFTFENWGKAVRAGRTFTTSGPLISLTVDGRTLGEEIRIGAGGATLEVSAQAISLWPLHLLEIVVNGRVVASTSSSKGRKALSLNEKIKLKDTCWIAARCGSRSMVQHCWPIHLGAHTSPVYVVVGDRELFSPSDASYMLTLIDGGLTYLDKLSVRYSEERHRQLKAVYRRARANLLQRLKSYR